MLARSTARSTTLGLKVAPSGELEQRGDSGPSNQVDAAATPAVTPIRPAKGHEFLAPKRDDTISAAAGLDPDSALVDINAHKLCTTPPMPVDRTISYDRQLDRFPLYVRPPAQVTPTLDSFCTADEVHRLVRMTMPPITKHRIKREREKRTF